MRNQLKSDDYKVEEEKQNETGDEKEKEKGEKKEKEQEKKEEEKGKEKGKEKWKENLEARKKERERERGREKEKVPSVKLNGLQSVQNRYACRNHSVIEHSQIESPCLSPNNKEQREHKIQNVQQARPKTNNDFSLVLF